MALKDRAMLVRLERKNIWRGKVNDTNLSDELRTKYGLKSSKQLATIRDLFDADNSPLTPVINAVNHVDYVYRSRTMPWMPGMNIMPTYSFLDFQTVIGQALQELEDRRAELIADYPAAVQAGVAASNGLATVADYPPVEAISEMYNCVISYFPVPESSDWRLPLPEEVVKEISATLDDTNERLIAETVQHHWKSLISAFESAIKNLDGARMRPEWLSNLKDLAASLPNLNLAHDPNIDYAARKIAEICGQLELQDLKGSQTLKRDTKADIQGLYDELKEMMG